MPGTRRFPRPMVSVTFIQDPDLKPVATSLYAFASRFDRDWALTNAASG